MKTQTQFSDQTDLAKIKEAIIPPLAGFSSLGALFGTAIGAMRGANTAVSIVDGFPVAAPLGNVLLSAAEGGAKGAAFFGGVTAFALATQWVTNKLMDIFEAEAEARDNVQKTTTTFAVIGGTVAGSGIMAGDLPTTSVGLAIAAAPFALGALAIGFCKVAEMAIDGIAGVGSMIGHAFSPQPPGPQ